MKIDTSAATAMAGVHAVLTGADIGERFFGCMLKDWPILAYERVKFVGEYVVAVAADSRAIAEAAAAAVDIEYEELPAVFDPEAAIEPNAPLFHPNDELFKYALGERPPRPHRNMHGYDVLRKGDPEQALAASERVFEHTFTTPRTHAGYLEPRATLVWIDDAGALHVLSTNKSPFALRDQLAMATGLPKDKVVIHPSFVGGEFGGKALTIEEFPLYFLAAATKRPVKHVRSHADDIRSTHVRHASTIRVRIGTKNDGTFEACDIRVVFDGGAYAAGKPVPWLMPGRAPKLPYKIEHAQVERMTVYTNTIPGGFVRAPGDIQTIFAVESLIDMIAQDLQHRSARAAPAQCREGRRHRSRRQPVRQTARGRNARNACARNSAGTSRCPKAAATGFRLTARHIAGGKTSFIVTAREDGSIAVDTGVAEPGVGTLTVIQRVLAARTRRRSRSASRSNAAPPTPCRGIPASAAAKARCCSGAPRSTPRANCAPRSRCRTTDRSALPARASTSITTATRSG